MSIHLATSRGRPKPGQGSTSSLRRKFLIVLTALALPVAVLAAPSAIAAHPEASLAGSNFEIDTDANLKVDDPAPPSLDWGNVAEIRVTDKVNGTGDNSYAGGVKEDTACPGETTDSIPPNKSDLLSFSVYREAGSGSHPGFLNLAWSRVNDPTGTTLMDFEFNQSSTPCVGSPNVIRTAGDLLIEYAIDQGGSQANMTVRTWSGSAWGPASSLTASTACGGGPCAAGTINSSTIPSADSDGLITSGEMAARTFGEAQIDLRLIFQANKCSSFGSAMLKSRSSDAFNSQLKDFVSPASINLTNCGQVIIRKQTDPDENPNSTSFGYTKAFSTDPVSTNTFSLTDDGVKDFGKTVLFGAGYTVNETTIPSGWDFVSVNCAASTGVTPTIVGSLVTFAIDADTDVLDCTYTNRARGTIIIEKVTSDGFGAFDFTSNSLTPASWTLTTTAAGAAGKDSRTFPDLAPGTYDAAETVPTGWNLDSATCSDGSLVSAIGLSGGETVTCTFTNSRERGAILILKERKHAAAGTGDHPHAGVTFTVKGGDLPAAGLTAVTDANGYACVGGLVVSSLVGNYSVTETVPTGYVLKSTNPQTGIAVTESTCAGKLAADPVVNDAYFLNMPLTNLTVSVDSQIDGGTASTIACVDEAAASVASGSTGANGDGSATANNLEPGTYTCTVVIDP